MSKKKVTTFLLLLFVLNVSLSQSLNSFDMNIDFIPDSTRYQRSKWNNINSHIINKDIYFVGESHNVLSNTRKHFTLFTYLYYNAGVRVYVMEGNYSFAYFINKYIQTGEQRHLDKVLQEDPNQDSMSLSLSDGFNKFYNNLYEFNNTLPANEKIELVSIDGEPFYYTSEMILEIIKEKGDIPKEIESTIKLMMDFKLQNRYAYLPLSERKKVKKVLTIARQNYATYYHIYKEYFKDDLFYIEMVINNEATLRRSEKALLKNFITTADHLQHKKFYFQYGNLHARIKSKWLANLINESPSFKDRVLSIGTQYNNCNYWWGEPVLNKTFGAISSYNKNIEKKYIENISKTSRSKYSLIKLNDFLKKKTGFDYILDIKGRYEHL